MAYIVKSNNFIREVTIKRYDGGFYLVTLDTGGGLKVRVKCLFLTKEDATAYISSIGRLPRKEITESPSMQTTYRDAPVGFKSAAAMCQLKGKQENKATRNHDYIISCSLVFSRKSLN